jgi:ISXO2-like transposase domain
MLGGENSITGSYNQLCRSLKTEADAFDFAVKIGLIRQVSVCDCGASMEWGPDSGEKFGLRWRCTQSRKLCGKTRSILSNSWFSASRVGLHDQILMIYSYCIETKAKQMRGMFGFGCDNTCVDWVNYFRNVCMIHMRENGSRKIVGEGFTVEIDESMLRRRKNNKGRLTVDESVGNWVFGGICRETKESFYKIVSDRTESTLMAELVDHVHSGTHVISDGWRAYSNIAKYGFMHSTVNHSENFVDPCNPSIHTQLIERSWRGLKCTIPGSARQENRESYIAEFKFKQSVGWHERSVPERFDLVVGVIAKYWN